jgi:hypothetical protein
MMLDTGCLMLDKCKNGFQPLLSWPATYRMTALYEQLFSRAKRESSIPYPASSIIAQNQ